jgi:alpha-L-arabinofuranosidase
VVEGLRRVWPRIIRFPGGCFASFYHWRDGVGPRHERRPRESVFWGGLEYNDVGTDEYVQLCRMLRAEPFLCVNMMTGSPEEAADWVAYCNAARNHPMGRLRALNGNPEPYGIRYWELDNETYRKYGPEEYARRSVEFARAMKSVDPSIQIVMVGYGPFNAELGRMLGIAGGFIDLVSDRAKGENHLRRDLEVIANYNRRTGRSIRLCNTEWLAPWSEVPPDSGALNVALLDPNMSLQEQQIRWRYAMNAARQLLVFQRLGGDLEFANFNNLANSWGQNVVECPKEKVFLSAAGLVFEMFSRSPAAWPLKLRLGNGEHGLEAQAAWSLDRQSLVLVVLNYAASEKQVVFDLSALGRKMATAEETVLTAPSPMSFHSAANSDVVRRHQVRHQFARPMFPLRAPPYSAVHALLR